MCDIIYINGNIVTVDEKIQNAEAVAVKDGKILAVDSKEEILKLKGESTKVVDLEGKTLMPGFIDGHGHFLMASLLAIYPSVAYPPVGGCETIKDISNLLEKYIKENNIPDGEMVIATGYDGGLFKDGRMLNKFDLDKISSTHKIYLIHASMHTGVANSMFLESLGIDATTEDAPGGHIGRLEGSNEPNGVLEEANHFHPLFGFLKQPTSQEEIAKVLNSAQQYYAKQGITTAQEAALELKNQDMLKKAAENNLLYMDLVSYVIGMKKTDFESIIDTCDDFGGYDNHYRTAGLKIVLDGSPQARTAWLSKPYTSCPPQPEDYCGIPIYKDNEEVINIFEVQLKAKKQIHIHTNGDAATEQFLDCYEEAVRRTGIKDDLRPVIIHAQTIREDQLDRCPAINATPSFFAMHTYFWGDTHIKNFGKERAFNISPIRWAVDRNIPFSLHCDTPVLPPMTMFMLYTAVNRITRSSVIIGENQRATVMEALKGLTINAAYQLFEEDLKGSITPGKLADFTVLDKNPLNVDVESLKDIKVLETIKEGNVIYKLED